MWCLLMNILRQVQSCRCGYHGMMARNVLGQDPSRRRNRSKSLLLSLLALRDPLRFHDLHSVEDRWRSRTPKVFRFTDVILIESADPISLGLLLAADGTSPGHPDHAGQVNIASLEVTYVNFHELQNAVPGNVVFPGTRLCFCDPNEKSGTSNV